MFLAPIAALALVATPDRAFVNAFNEAADYCHRSILNTKQPAQLVRAGFVAGSYEGTWSWPAANPRISINDNAGCSFEVNDPMFPQEDFVQLSEAWFRSNGFRVIPYQDGAASFLEAQTPTVRVGANRSFGDAYYLAFYARSAS